MFDDEYITKHFYSELPPINEIKMACGFTWKEFAIKMGVSEMTLWRWNSSEAHCPLHQRVKLREILVKSRSTIKSNE